MESGLRGEGREVRWKMKSTLIEVIIIANLVEWRKREEGEWCMCTWICIYNITAMIGNDDDDDDRQ